MATYTNQIYDYVSARYGNVDWATIEVALFSVSIFMMIRYITFTQAQIKFYSDIDDIFVYINEIEEQLNDLKETVSRIKKKSSSVKTKPITVAVTENVTDVQMMPLPPRVDRSPSPTPRNGITNPAFQAWSKQHNESYKATYPTMKPMQLRSKLYADWKAETKS
jgi:hypothetical protein